MRYACAMAIVITWSTVYGSSRAYAQALAGKLGLEAHPISRAGLSDGDLLIHFGGLYAGGLCGLKDFIRLASSKGVTPVIATVGLADPAKPRNREKIEEDVSKHLPHGLAGKVRFFHFRGAMDYKKLSIRHRAMMWALVVMLKKKDPASLSDEDKSLIATHGQKIDFIDFNTLDGLASWAREQL